MQLDLPSHITSTRHAATDLPELADFALLRVSSLPFAAIEALRLRETEALLDRISRAEATMNALRENLAEALHRLVPALELDQDLRRTVINLRRHIHNGRTHRPKERHLQALRGLMTDPEELRLLEHWLAAQADLAKAEAQLDTTIAREIQTVLRPNLRAPLAVPHFARAVALANLRVLKDANHERKLPKTPWPDKLERSLLGYLARASVKTSPFSSFMGNAIVDINPMATGLVHAGSSARFTGQSVLNRGVTSQLAEASFAAIARTTALPLMVNPTLRAMGGGRQVGLCGRQIVLGGRAWYEQRWAQFLLQPELEALLPPGRSLGWRGWRQALLDIGLTPATAETTLSKLVERGILIAVPVADGFEPNPAARLSERCRTSADLTPLALAVTKLDEVARSIGQLDAQQRIPALGEVDALHQHANALAGMPKGAETLQNIVTEDCWLEGVQGEIGGALLSPLADLQDFLSGQVAISPVYTRLVRAFLEVYGPDGTCDDVVSFLLAVVGQLIDLPEFGARTDQAMPEPAPPGVRVPVTAHAQIALQSGSEARLVINRMFDGAGWLATRFTHGTLDQQTRLTQGLRNWSRHIAGAGEPVEMPVSSHCSDLQAHRKITDRILDWPGEPTTRPADQLIRADDLRLRHDSETGFLRLVDRQGQAIDLQYLGNTLPTATWGVRYALSVLTRPFTLARPRLAPQDLDAKPAIFARPGVTHGRVVLRRDAWWVRASHVLEHWLEGTPAAQLRAVRRDCDRHALPRQLFAQAHVPERRNSLIMQDMMDVNRKPIWLDLANPFWLAMLGRIARKSDWIVLSRAQPGPEELWFRIGDQPHATELHLEMTITAGQRQRSS
ncbi:hypothetical protein [Paracoccus aminophilus]|nr:hypothetical protein [Paracoccus aminophilus]